MAGCDGWMRHYDEAIINCGNYGEAITFDLATSGEKKEKKKAIAEKRRRQRSQRYYEVHCKSLFAQNIHRGEKRPTNQESRELLSTGGGNWNLRLVKVSTWYGHERQ